MNVYAKKCTLPHIGEVLIPKEEPCDVWAHWEVFLKDFILSRISQDTIFIDIGANIGYFSLWAATKAKKVFAVEPNPIIYGLLKHNSLKFPNIDTYNIAISNLVATTQFYYRIGAAGDGRLYDPKDKNTWSVKITPVETLSNFSKKYCGDLPINLIKIDCEGSEYEILRDQEFFRRNKNCEVVLELHTAIIESRGLNYSEFADYLESNFKLFRLDGQIYDPHKACERCHILLKSI